MRALVGIMAVAAALVLTACNGSSEAPEANNALVETETLPGDEAAAAGNEGGNEAANASDDKGSDDRGSDDRGSDDRGSDDRGSDDRGSDDRGSDDR